MDETTLRAKVTHQKSSYIEFRKSKIPSPMMIDPVSLFFFISHIILDDHASIVKRWSGKFISCIYKWIECVNIMKRELFILHTNQISLTGVFIIFF